MAKSKVLEDGSQASTGHPKKRALRPKTKETDGTAAIPNKKIINVDDSVRQRVGTEKKVESYSYRIRNEVRRLAELTDEISREYSAYAESDSRVDTGISIHNGLGNMLKLIEIQTTAKLRIKKMQANIMEAIAATSSDEELPYAIQDIMREVNVNFLDSKLVRAYGEISRVMKEDLDLSAQQDGQIKFVGSALSSELEAMPCITGAEEKTHIKEDDGDEGDGDGTGEGKSWGER